MDLWNEIIKDYEPHPDIDFGVEYWSCLSIPRGNEHELQTTPSEYLGIKVYDMHFPSQKESFIKEYFGDFSEQSIRDFIEEFAMNESHI